MANTRRLSGWLLSLCVSGATSANVFEGVVAHADEDSSYFLVGLIPPVDAEDKELIIYVVQADSPSDAFNCVLREKEEGYSLSVFTAGIEPSGKDQVISMVQVLLPRLQAGLAQALAGGGLPDSEPNESGGTIH